MSTPKVPKVFNISYLQHPSDAFTKLYMFLKNLYGLKYTVSTLFEFLKYGLVDRG